MNTTLDILHMNSHSYGAVPLQYGEKAGWWSLVNWHCGLPMRKVKKSDGAEIMKAWICPHCSHRKYPPLMKE